MMDNQHKKISGYRDLTQEEIDLMNEIKSKGIELGSLIDRLDSIAHIDKRWVEIGKTHAQESLMALTRSVARPTHF